VTPPDKVLEALLELTKTFTQDLPLEQILREITAACLRLFPGNHCSVRVLNDEQTELVCGARSGEGSEAPPMVFRRGEGIIGWVVDYNSTAMIRDTETDARFKPARNQGFGIRSMLAVPIRVGSKVIGVLAVTASRPEAFSMEDLALIQLLANCSVPIIEKARLERLSPFDDLTLAYKEIHLISRLEGNMESASRLGRTLSMIVLGLDRLDVVYKKHDFGVGNQVLRRFADRVRELGHFTSWLVRRGMESFVLVLPDADAATAHQHAMFLRENLEKHPLTLHDHPDVQQLASIGVATWDGEESVEDLLYRAEEASLQARVSGGNTVVVSGPGTLSPTPR
jgi:diguanylate cyclase (GGDEF)-like protein